MTQNHQKFLDHLKTSQHGVWLVAQWLNKNGHNVKINCAPMAPEASEWKKYADNGDLEVSLRVEVKQLSANFTTPDTWPFGNKIIVCAKHAWDNARPKPHAFIYLNAESTHVAMIFGRTHHLWTVEKKQDRRYDNVTQDFYITTPSNAFWAEINHEKWRANDKF